MPNPREMTSQLAMCAPYFTSYPLLVRFLHLQNFFYITLSIGLFQHRSEYNNWVRWGHVQVPLTFQDPDVIQTFGTRACIGTTPSFLCLHSVFRKILCPKSRLHTEENCNHYNCKQYCKVALSIKCFFFCHHLPCRVWGRQDQQKGYAKCQG